MVNGRQTGTHRLHIECGTAVDMPSLSCRVQATLGNTMSGEVVAINDQVDCGSIDTGALERRPACFQCQIAGLLTVCSDGAVRFRAGGNYVAGVYLCATPSSVQHLCGEDNR